MAPFFVPKLPLKRGAGSGAATVAPPRSGDPLDGVPLFALVSSEVRGRAKKKLTSRSVPEGRPLFKKDEASDELFVVQSGRFRLFLPERGGRGRVLQFVGPGEVLGEASFLAGSPHVTGADAVEPSRVWRIARADFDAFLGTEPDVMRYLAGVIAQRQAIANARLAAESTPDEARAERGYVTAVYSPRGGAGVTTLATAIAIALAERHPDDVALLDVALTFGHTLSYLWLSARGKLVDSPPNTIAQLDRRGLEYYLIPHSSSLRVVVTADSPKEGEHLTADHVRAAFGSLRRNFGHIVVDLPHGFPEPVLTALELADRVLLMSTPELTSLRDVIEFRRIYTEVLGLDPEKLRHLLNHPLPYAGVPIADFAAATGVPWEEIGHGGDGPALAALKGESLVATRPGNPATRAAVRLAELASREAREMQALAGRA